MRLGEIRDKAVSWLLARADSPQSRNSRILFGLACAGAGAIVRMAFASQFEGVPFVTFFPAVVVAGMVAGGMGALVCLLASIVLASIFWLPAGGQVTATLDSTHSLIVFVILGFLIAALSAVLHALVAQLREAERVAVVTADEMQHRLANLLAVVQAMARTTLVDSPGAAEFRERLHAIARAQKAAVAHRAVPGGGAFRLAPLLEKALEPFDRKRIDISGEETAVDARSAHMLGLVFYELGTNSLKYGSLSAPAGKVAISWGVVDDIVRLTWKETGGPPVIEPERHGSGLKLVQAAFPPRDRSQGVSFAHDGFACVLDLPLASKAR